VSPPRVRGTSGGVKLRSVTAILPRGGSHHPTKPSRFAQWRARVGDRIARSSRVFLLGLVVACGVEVLVDWNQTLMEINVLRNAVRQKGESYVGILSKASDDELAAKDRTGLERLTHGVFDDEDTVYVRFTDLGGAVVWDSLTREFGDAYAKRGKGGFVEHYTHAMERDTQGILTDPEAFRARVANSRYKDFAQTWTDATAKAIALVVPPKAEARARGIIVYQDRLRDENHERDDKVSYAIGTVRSDDGVTVGTVLVAFDMKRTNDAIGVKYLKFAGLVVFFVGLILVQNTVSRRNKLRLLDLEERYGAAKRALRDAMPRDEVRCGALLANGHVQQAKGPVDGMVWSAADEGESVLAVVIDPDGDGIDAAAVGLHVVRAFNARRKDGARPTLDDELRALGEAALSIPLTRPVGVALDPAHASGRRLARARRRADRRVPRAREPLRRAARRRGEQGPTRRARAQRGRAAGGRDRPARARVRDARTRPIGRRRLLREREAGRAGLRRRRRALPRADPRGRHRRPRRGRGDLGARPQRRAGRERHRRRGRDPRIGPDLIIVNWGPHHLWLRLS